MNNEKNLHLSTDKILLAAIKMVGKKHEKFPALHLDVGSGSGELIALMSSRFEVKSSACDYTSELMGEAGVCVDVADLNIDGLPYADKFFDIVTCTEVIEHLENYRRIIREVHRVLKPGGTFVVTTPNILNLKSRIRFLIFGFYNLFGPLHFKESKLYSAGGHITPIGLFYLVHSLVDADFEKIEISIDKRQSTSIFWLILFYVPIKIFASIVKRSEVKKYKTIDGENDLWVKSINSFDILLGRTLVVGAKKIDRD